MTVGQAAATAAHEAVGVGVVAWLLRSTRFQPRATLAVSAQGQK